MNPTFHAHSVMLEQVLAALGQVQAAWRLEPRPMPWLVDCTLGGGGHAAAMLAAWPEAQLLGLDRDPQAIAQCQARLAPYAQRVHLVQLPFAQLGEAMHQAGLPAGGAALVVADLGVSSHQIDTAARGFSWRFDAPLDMRMGAHGPTAAQLIAEAEPAALTRLLFTLGQERHARRIAYAVCQQRPSTTFALADVVQQAMPRGPPSRTHPATRTFQALRMAVNQELPQIQALVDQLPAAMACDAQACLISFHSLEDELVRDRLALAAAGCICPPRLPACGCGRAPLWQLSRPRLRRPTAQEVDGNPRARSARMRGGRRTDAPISAGPPDLGR